MSGNMTEERRAVSKSCFREAQMDSDMVVDQAASVGTSAAQTLNTTKGNYARATSSLAAATADFASSGRAMAFSDADRKRAAGSAG
jgi:hypothetical protein